MNDQAAAFAHMGLAVPTLERRVQILPCACGGRVRADVRFPQEGVRYHNRTKVHQGWRARREGALRDESNTTDTAIVLRR